MTAVEFLIDKFKIYLPSIHQKGLQDAFEQALEMERQQIIDACNLQRNDYRGMPTYNKSGEQYYNETYKKPLK